MNINDMMSEMMTECCSDDGVPDLGRMKAFMEKCGEQDFSEDELATMCQITRFALQKNFRSPEGKPDSGQMKELFGDCNCRRAS